MTTSPAAAAISGSPAPSRDVEDIALLASLPAASRARLLKDSRIELVPANETLFLEGETPKFFHAVLRGMVDLSTHYRGRSCTPLIMTAGDVFMPAAALSEEPYLVTARTLTLSRILMIDAALLREEAKKAPEVAMAMARLIAGQWRMALRIILDLKCRSSSERLAAFLLQLHDARAPGTAAQIPFSKRQLAARIGMQPESLSRTLQLLAANGLVVRGREIIVVDRERAEAFCGPDPYPSRGEDELGVYLL
jgi:CRP/FNR family transcriptional regulator, transcriptional activator FtrB